MPRSIRIEYPGAFYHVMARGNRRAPILADDDDRRFFFKALGEACEITGWRVHGWVLMSKHYHLMIETPEANLVDDSPHHNQRKIRPNPAGNSKLWT